MSMKASNRADTVDSPRTLRQLCEAAARCAGQIARDAFGRVGGVRLKSDASHVTDADEAAERAVIEMLNSIRPDDGIVGEESAARRAEEDASLKAAVQLPGDGAAQTFWVIDPIDGTRNYVNGIPLFASSVAVMRGGLPVAGAIYDPMRDALLSASAAEGAFSNGAPLHVERGAVNESQWLVAIPSQRYGQWHKLTQDWVEHLVVRNLGSATLHVAMVAAGQLDAALMTKCKLWDIAAGWVIVTAAGGAMTYPDGKPLFPLDVQNYASEAMPCLAARPGVHAKLIGQPIT